jgi:hypothetical protein
MRRRGKESGEGERVCKKTNLTTTVAAPKSPARGSTIPLSCPYLSHDIILMTNDNIMVIRITNRSPKTFPSAHSSSSERKTNSQAFREVLDPNSQCKIPVLRYIKGHNLQPAPTYLSLVAGLRSHQYSENTPPSLPPTLPPTLP